MRLAGGEPGHRNAVGHPHVKSHSKPDELVANIDVTCFDPRFNPCDSYQGRELGHQTANAIGLGTTSDTTASLAIRFAAWLTCD
jgi:hypothetical protein